VESGSQFHIQFQTKVWEGDVCGSLGEPAVISFELSGVVLAVSGTNVVGAIGAGGAGASDGVGTARSRAVAGSGLGFGVLAGVAAAGGSEESAAGIAGGITTETAGTTVLSVESGWAGMVAGGICAVAAVVSSAADTVAAIVVTVGAGGSPSSARAGRQFAPSARVAARPQSESRSRGEQVFTTIQRQTYPPSASSIQKCHSQSLPFSRSTS
jgi:hypothetical protein